MRWFALIAGLALGALLIALEAGFWAIALAIALGIRLLDLARARWSSRGGVPHCPSGHAIPTEGGTYECQACGFTYVGSVWLCGNPECRAITSFVDCPVCGLSCRNPYRWGR